MQKALKINPEFRNLIPPLAPEELAQLEENIVKDGCRDPLVAWEGVIVDGHNRYEICTRKKIPFTVVEIQFGDADEAKDWIDKNQLGRRNLTADSFRLLLGRRYNRQKKAVGKPEGSKLGQSEPISTAEKLASEHGVSSATVKRAGKFAEEVERKPELQKAIHDRTPVKKVVKEQRKVDAAKSLETAKRKLATVDISDKCDIRKCSMEKLLASGIKPDCIITDPPYPKEFMHLYGKMAELAKDIPLVAVMCGQSYLPEIIAEMSKHLEYRWMLAYLTPGGQAVQVWDRKVNTFWKPILLFGKGVWIGDVCKSDVNDNDKRFHGWGQSESGMGDLVDRLSKPGQLVCDPFCGAGTTGVVSLRLGRRFVGCDIDAGCVENATVRCKEACNE